MNSHKRTQNSSKGYGQSLKSQNCLKLAKLDRNTRHHRTTDSHRPNNSRCVATYYGYCRHQRSPTLTMLPLHHTHITLLRLPTLVEAQILHRRPMRAWPYIVLLSFASHKLPLTADLPLTAALPLRRGPTHARLRTTLLRLPSCAPSLTPVLLPHRGTLIPPPNRRSVADRRFSRRLCSFVARHTLDSRFFLLIFWFCLFPTFSTFMKFGLLKGSTTHRKPW